MESQFASGRTDCPEACWLQLPVRRLRASHALCGRNGGSMRSHAGTAPGLAYRARRGSTARDRLHVCDAPGRDPREFHIGGAAPGAPGCTGSHSIRQNKKF